MEDLLLLKLCALDKFEVHKKGVQEKFIDLDTKILNLEKRGDANKIMEALKEIVKELETKVFGLDREEK